MSFIEVKLPAMGEGIVDATITKWLVKEGDTVELDTPLVEIATDKVDSEVPSPADGTVSKLLFKEGDTPKVGQVLVVIETISKSASDTTKNTPSVSFKSDTPSFKLEEDTKGAVKAPASDATSIPTHLNNGSFIPPLVRQIAKKEGLSLADLENITGTGIDGKLSKADILAYLSAHKNEEIIEEAPLAGKEISTKPESVEIIEMDRMRKLISSHMTLSKQTSAHVTSFIEVDMTNIVTWREKNKDKFYKTNGDKITFTPFFFIAVAEAIKKYPILNSSVADDQIHIKKDINIGMATALPNNNLIVPVIKNADRLNLAGLAREVNDLALRARSSKLSPTEIQGGTFTITNLGAFDNLAGTPIINQPQVAILAVGAIKKRPVVIENPLGDTVGIRQIAILSLSYDHRIIDGALGGAFLKQVALNLENFSTPDL